MWDGLRSPFGRAGRPATMPRTGPRPGRQVRCAEPTAATAAPPPRRDRWRLRPAGLARFGRRGRGAPAARRSRPACRHAGDDGRRRRVPYLGLVQPWGEVYPHWIPYLRGKPARFCAAIVPAAPCRGPEHFRRSCSPVPRFSAISGSSARPGNGRPRVPLPDLGDSPSPPRPVRPSLRALTGEPSSSGVILACSRSPVTAEGAPRSHWTQPHCKC